MNEVAAAFEFITDVNNHVLMDIKGVFNRTEAVDKGFYIGGYKNGILQFKISSRL